mgnify:CR=1 FL=1
MVVCENLVQCTYTDSISAITHSLIMRYFELNFHIQFHILSTTSISLGKCFLAVKRRRMVTNQESFMPLKQWRKLNWLKRTWLTKVRKKTDNFKCIFKRKKYLNDHYLSSFCSYCRKRCFGNIKKSAHCSSLLFLPVKRSNISGESFFCRPTLKPLCCTDYIFNILILGYGILDWWRREIIVAQHGILRRANV